MTKHALLIGINYNGTNNKLNGCINDVKVMKKHIIEKRGYSEANIVTLTEDQSDPKRRPTGFNIMHELSRLILKAHTGGATELWLHYSGHGSNIKDKDGDEDDGRDETIVPLDFAKNGMITDDQLHDYLEHIPASCRMYCIFDCCHSGTILDLRYQYTGDSKNGVENKDSRIKANIIMISGCMDTQTSADARIRGKWAGAMTTAYINCVKSDVECDDLLNDMRNYLKSNGYTQQPQLCSSNPIKEHQKW